MEGRAIVTCEDLTRSFHEPPRVPFALLGEPGATPRCEEMLERLGGQIMVDGLRWMLFSRRLDTKCVSKQRQGKLGTYPPAEGQEATIVGAALALDPGRDWIVPQYREGAALVRHRLPLEQLLLYFRGDPRSGAIPASVKMLPPQIAIAAHLPHAVGLGWGLQLQGHDSVVLTFVGDGGSSEGDFHEALNLAGVQRSPIVFVLQNNGWAISTPRSRQSAAQTLASRAAGYGIAGCYVDGNDFLAMLTVVTEAVARARAGDGPSLIEAVTYRVGPHNTADDPKRYRGNVVLDKHCDPITRLSGYLRSRGLVDDELIGRFESENRLVIERAFRAVDEVAPLARSDLTQHVVATDAIPLR